MRYIISYTMLTGTAVRIAHSEEEAGEAMAALKSAGSGPVTVEIEDASGRRELVGSLALGQPQPGLVTLPARPGLTRPPDRRIDPSSHSVSLADARRPDCPLIYVNRGFEFLTGYTREECIGLNCRFLQGAATNPVAVAQMRDATLRGKPLLIDVLNYRKDGSEFWNRVSLKPVHSARGELTHVIGIQSDITRMLELQKTLEEWAKDLGEMPPTTHTPAVIK